MDEKVTVFIVAIAMLFADERDEVEDLVGVYTTREKAQKVKQSWIEVENNKEWAESAILFRLNIYERELE